MMEITGMDGLLRRLDEMGRRAQALDGKEQRVPLTEQFTAAFMASHTDYGSFLAMCDASGLFQREDDVKDDFDSQEWNDFVVRHTKFDSWRDMYLRAAREYASRYAAKALRI